MAVKQIQYPDKAQGAKGSTNPIHNVNWTDLNEIKNTVNNNAVILANLVYRTPIPVESTGGITIDWKNDIIPDDLLERTYFERFGNVLNGFFGVQINENNTESGYFPEYSTNRVDGEIISVEVILLMIGTFTII